MKSDKLMITVRGADSELSRLTALLSSLADMPPVIPFELMVLGEPGSTKLEDYCGSCTGVAYAERSRDLGVEIDSIAKASKCNLQLVLHSDVIFSNHVWCEVIFQKMIESGAAIMGAMPFKTFKVGDHDIQVMSSWFLAYDFEQLSKVGGLSSDCGESSWVAAYLRAKKMSMYCVGADLSGVVIHTGRCWLDAERPKGELVRDEQSVEILSIKENLL